MSEKTFYPVGYEDGEAKFRAFKLAEGVKYSRLVKIMRDPLGKEDIQFKSLVEVFNPLFVLPDNKPIESLDLMAFRELCVMASSYSAKNHATYYSFQCTEGIIDNPERETKELIYNSMKNDSETTEDELKEMEELLAGMEKELPCDHVVKDNVSFMDLKSDIPKLFQRHIESEGVVVYYYTVAHKLMLDKFEIEYFKQMRMMRDVKTTEDIVPFSDNMKLVVFDILKVALHLVSQADLTMDKVKEKYNELLDIDSSTFQTINNSIQTIIDEKPKFITVPCPNCGTKYRLKFDVEDFKLIPD